MLCGKYKLVLNADFISIHTLKGRHNYLYLYNLICFSKIWHTFSFFKFSLINFLFHFYIRHQIFPRNGNEKILHFKYLHIHNVIQFKYLQISKYNWKMFSFKQVNRSVWSLFSYNLLRKAQFINSSQFYFTSFLFYFFFVLELLSYIV